MVDLLHTDMFTLLSDVCRSETLRIQQGNPAKFGYLTMMTVATLGSLNAESFCESVIRMLVMLRMNHEFIEYMRTSYPDTSLSEFRSVDTYVCDHGGVEALEDDEDDE